MPFNGAGTFTLVAGNPVVTGTVISSTVQNNTMTDIANGLTDCITKDGQSTPTISIPMGGFTINSLGNAVNPQDALTLSQTKGRLLNVQRFTNAGSFTYTSTTGTTAVIVELVGGGAGGGGCGATTASQAALAGGGGAGSYARGRFTSAFSGVTVTVGAGGIGGSAGAANPGIAGGTTSFGALMSAPGGSAGPAGTAAVPPLSGASSNISGTPTGANIVSGNGASSNPGVASILTSFVPSSGAASAFGGGGIAFPSPGGGGQAAISVGAGGGAAASGPSQAGFAGGAGFTGIAIIYEFGTAATVA